MDFIPRRFRKGVRKLSRNINTSLRNYVNGALIDAGVVFIVSSLAFAIIGLKKGLIIEAFNLASFIIGVWGAMCFSDWVADWLSGYVDAALDYLPIIAFIITFVIFLLLTRWLGHLVSNLVSAIHLGIFDKIGGFLFGILKGGLILSILILIMNVFGYIM